MLGKLKQFNVLLIIPIEIVLWVVLIFPFALVFYLSFTNWSPALGKGIYEATFIGLANYAEILFTPRFLEAMGRTLVILGVGVPLQFLIGLSLAMLFVDNFRGRKVFISIVMVPMMVIPAIVGVIFFTMFLTNGPINAILSAFAGQTIQIAWLVDPNIVLLPIILADTWEWTPFMFLITLAGLLALPQDPFRAARVLGASEWHIFRHLTLPMLKPIITIAILIRSLEIFKIFDVPVLMTRGGPATASETISIYLYLEGFQFLRLAYIAAGAFIILFAILIVTIYVSRPLMRAAE